MNEQPKNRIDIILAEVISEDVGKLIALKTKYRGIDGSKQLNECLNNAIHILRKVYQSL